MPGCKSKEKCLHLLGNRITVKFSSTLYFWMGLWRSVCHKSHTSHARHSHFLPNDSCDIYYRFIFQNSQHDSRIGSHQVPQPEAHSDGALIWNRVVLSVPSAPRGWWQWRGWFPSPSALSPRSVEIAGTAGTDGTRADRSRPEKEGAGCAWRSPCQVIHNPFRRNVSFRFIPAVFPWRPLASTDSTDARRY